MLLNQTRNGTANTSKMTEIWPDMTTGAGIVASTYSEIVIAGKGSAYVLDSHLLQLTFRLASMGPWYTRYRRGNHEKFIIIKFRNYISRPYAS